MFDVNALKSSFGRAAEQYDTYALLQKQVRTYTMQMAQAYWPVAGNILDMGCGTSALAQELKASGSKLGVYSIDISYGMCRQSRLQTSHVANANAACTPFADAMFAGIFSSLMLQWVDTPGRVFSEMARLLKPGGHAVVSTLAEGTLYELKHAFTSLDNLPHVSDFAAPHTLLEAAKAAGLSLAVAKQNKIVEYYPDTIALMRGLQAIGASNKHTARGKGLMTSAKFAKLEAAYAKAFAKPEGLPATWQVLTLVLGKEKI